ncbi:hypothetical protein NL676_004667 [Syzygium grande]|nr:hypothetical protein NL676_004667 [Syzygium grande]
MTSEKKSERKWGKWSRWSPWGEAGRGGDPPRGLSLPLPAPAPALARRGSHLAPIRDDSRGGWKYGMEFLVRRSGEYGPGENTGEFGRGALGCKFLKRSGQFQLGGGQDEYAEPRSRSLKA